MRPIEKWIWLADDENNRNAHSPEQDINYLVAEFRRTYALRDAESGNGKRKNTCLDRTERAEPGVESAGFIKEKWI